MERLKPEPKIPEEIFPLEIWDMILNNLNFPTDLASCFRTCVAWRKLLESKRKIFLMPEVFPFIYDYLAADGNEHDGNSAGNLREGDESSVPGNSVFTIRLVCRSWKLGVNDFLQHPSHHTDIGFNPRPKKNIAAFLQPYFFSSEFEHFLSMFDHPIRNPLISRFFKYVHYGSNINQNWTALEIFLEKVGYQIFYAELGFPIGRIYSTTNVYNLLKRQLNLMPNLKTLKVSFKLINTTGRRENFHVYLENYLRYTFDPVQLLLESSPLPKLECLTTLTLDNVPELIEKGIILANSHVKQLKLESRVQGFPESSLGIPEYLKSVEMPNVAKFVTNLKVQKDLLTLQSISWPIRTLEINSDVKIDKVFAALPKSRFAPELDILKVFAFDHQYFGKVTKKLNLPKLKTLLLNVQSPLKNMKYLLPTCAPLINLEVEMMMFQLSTSMEQDHPMTTRSIMKNTEETRPVDQGEHFTYSNSKSHFFNRCPKLRRITFRTFNSPSSFETNELTRDQYNDVRLMMTT